MRTRRVQRVWAVRAGDSILPGRVVLDPHHAWRILVVGAASCTYFQISHHQLIKKRSPVIQDGAEDEGTLAASQTPHGRAPDPPTTMVSNLSSSTSRKDQKSRDQSAHPFQKFRLQASSSLPHGNRPTRGLRRVIARTRALRSNRRMPGAEERQSLRAEKPCRRPGIRGSEEAERHDQGRDRGAVPHANAAA